MFTDMCELLLSSEAKVVTHVDAKGTRTTCTVEGVLCTGNADITRRLKYIKHILYELIHPPTAYKNAAEM
jgi:hypothetical protein